MWNRRVLRALLVMAIVLAGVRSAGATAARTPDDPVSQRSGSLAPTVPRERLQRWRRAPAYNRTRLEQIRRFADRLPPGDRVISIRKVNPRWHNGSQFKLFIPEGVFELRDLSGLFDGSGPENRIHLMIEGSDDDELRIMQSALRQNASALGHELGQISISKLLPGALKLPTFQPIRARGLRIEVGEVRQEKGPFAGLAARYRQDYRLFNWLGIREGGFEAKARSRSLLQRFFRMVSGFFGAARSDQTVEDVVRQAHAQLKRRFGLDAGELQIQLSKEFGGTIIAERSGRGRSWLGA